MKNRFALLAGTKRKARTRAGAIGAKRRRKDKGSACGNRFSACRNEESGHTIIRSVRTNGEERGRRFDIAVLRGSWR
jgi:hypothetical protein